MSTYGLKPEQKVRIKKTIADACALISNPKKWTKDEDAVDAEGAGVPPRSPKAVKWCASGALFKVAPVRTARLVRRRFGDWLEVKRGSDLTLEDINDDEGRVTAIKELRNFAKSLDRRI